MTEFRKGDRVMLIDDSLPDKWVSGKGYVSQKMKGYRYGQVFTVEAVKVKTHKKVTRGHYNYYLRRWVTKTYKRELKRPVVKLRLEGCYNELLARRFRKMI